MPSALHLRRSVIAVGVCVPLLATGRSYAVDRGDEAPRSGDAPPDEVRVRGGQTGGFSSRAREGDAVREVTDAASLVEPLPGVHVRRFGGDDSFATLSIRGSSSTQVVIYLAGVPLTGGADPSLDLATLPLWPGSQARVHRSFAPASLGPGSLGGTLVVDAPRPNAAPGFDAWTAVGSFGARRLRLGGVVDTSAAGETSGGRISFALSASRSDDDFTYHDPLASGARGEDVTAVRQNAGHAAANGLVAWSLPLHGGPFDGATLTVTTMAQVRRQHLPGPLFRPTPFQVLDSDRELVSTELAWRGGPGVWSARAWGRRNGLRVRDRAGVGAALFGPTRTDDTIVATGGSFGWRGLLDDVLLLEVRTDGSGERFAPGEREGASPVPGATRASVGLGVDAEWHPAPPWALATSGRVNTWRDSSVGAAGADAVELRPTGHVGTEISLGPLVLAAHGGAVARPPSFVERFGNRGAFLGDPGLRPESAFVVDAGTRWGGRMGPVRLELELVGFGTWAEDLIVFVPVGAFGYSKATNIGRARLLGAESEVRATLGPLSVRVSHTGLVTANAAKGACLVQVGRCERPPLPGRPEHDLVADAVYTWGPVRVRYGIDAVTGITADLGGTVGVPSRVLQSAGARLAIPGVRGLTLALDVRNLFDVRTVYYEGAGGARVREPIGDLFDYPIPGRSFLLSARLHLPAGE